MRRILQAIGVIYALWLVLVGFYVYGLTIGGNFHPIVEGAAYRSAQVTPDFLRRIQRETGIRSIINLRGAWNDDEWYLQEANTAKELGLAQYDVRMFSHRLAPMRELRKLVQAFDECPKPLLVHCRRGADRTALAAAIYLLLYEDHSLEEAVKTYSYRYGHFPFARGYHLPHLFDCYDRWLAEEGTAHSPNEFRRWIQTSAAVGPFDAKMELSDDEIVLRAGMVNTIELTVTNVSRYPWVVEGDCTDGIHARLQILRTPDRAPVIEDLSFGSEPSVVEPGNQMRVTLTIPPIAEQGKYTLIADLIDSHEFSFCEMGRGRIEREIAVVAMSYVETKD